MTSGETCAPFVIRSGKFHIYVTNDTHEIEDAQRLRYDVFFSEMGASPSESDVAGRDVNVFDPFCEHLIVKDVQAKKVVGTYRLLRREGAKRHGSYYSEGEFNIDKLKATKGEILEVSRSCVDQSYRTQTVMQLLLRGLAEYILHYNITYLFGCGSFHGTDTKPFEHALSYLYYNHLAPIAHRPVTLPQHFKPLNILPADKVDEKLAFQQMPPLLRGYMRLGGTVGDGVFVDHAFNTTDVCVVVDSDCLTPRFAQRYNTQTEQERRFAIKA